MSLCCQSRIKVRGGPRLDTVMGPHPSFSSYHRLRKPRVWDFVPPPSPEKKLYCKWPQVIFRAFCIRPICQDKSAVFPTRRIPITVSHINDYQSNRAMNHNGCKRSSNKTQGSSRHDACRRRLLCIYQFSTVKFFEHISLSSPKPSMQSTDGMSRHRLTPYKPTIIHDKC